jgi:hypothetical protein
MKKLILILIFSLFYETESKYNNIVEYPKGLKNDVYKFHLVVKHGLAMAVRNDMRETYDPVGYDIEKQVFWKNVKTDHGCDYNQQVVNKSEEDSIYTVCGKHREMLFINNQFPGPSIIVPYKAKLEIIVTNELLTDVITMHWHGQTQKNTFIHDGGCLFSL